MIQSPARCASSSGVSCASSVRSSGMAGPSRVWSVSSATPRAVADGDDQLHQVGDRFGELADAARRGVDLGAAQHVGELARRRGDGGQRSAGLVEDLAEQVVRMQRLDLDDQLVAQDQAEDGVVAEAGLVDPIEAHGGDDLTRGRDVPIDGVEQRPPGSGRGWPGRRRCHSAGR